MTLGTAASSSIKKVSASEIFGRRQLHQEDRGPDAQRDSHKERQEKDVTTVP